MFKQPAGIYQWFLMYAIAGFSQYSIFGKISMVMYSIKLPAEDASQLMWLLQNGWCLALLPCAWLVTRRLAYKQAGQLGMALLVLAHLLFFWQSKTGFGMALTVHSVAYALICPAALAGVSSYFAEANNKKDSAFLLCLLIASLARALSPLLINLPLISMDSKPEYGMVLLPAFMAFAHLLIFRNVSFPAQTDIATNNTHRPWALLWLPLTVYFAFYVLFHLQDYLLPGQTDIGNDYLPSLRKTVMGLVMLPAQLFFLYRWSQHPEKFSQMRKTAVVLWLTAAMTCLGILVTNTEIPPRLAHILSGAGWGLLMVVLPPVLFSMTSQLVPKNRLGIAMAIVLAIPGLSGLLVVSLMDYYLYVNDIESLAFKTASGVDPLLRVLALLLPVLALIMALLWQRLSKKQEQVLNLV